MSDVVSKKNKQRTDVLKGIYDLMDGEPRSAPYAALSACGQKLGLSEDETDSAFEWLVDNGYCKRYTSGSFQMTRAGAEAIEEILGGHDPEPVPPPPVTMNIHGGTFGAIQTGAHNVSHVAQQINSGVKVSEVLELIGKLREAAKAVSGENREEAIELVDAIEEQAKSSAPKLARVKSYAETLKLLLVAYAPMITEVVHHFANKTG